MNIESKNLIKEELVPRLRQVIDFSGLTFDGASFTNSDAEMEFKNIAWVLVESKYGNKDIPEGQRIALERKNNDLALSGKEVLTIIARHQVHDVGQKVPLAKSLVHSIYYKGKWYHYEREKFAVKELVAIFLKKAEEKRVDELIKKWR